MPDTATTVRKTLQRDIFLQELLARGLANTNAVARWLKEHYALNEATDALARALRRERERLDERSPNPIQTRLHEAKLRVRRPVTVLRLPRTQHVTLQAARALATVPLEAPHDVLHLAPTPTKILLVVDQDHASLIEETLDTPRPDRTGHLAQVTVEFPQGAPPPAGNLGLLHTSLEQRGLPVPHAYTNDSHHALIVDEDDVADTLEVLHTLTNDA